VLLRRILANLSRVVCLVILCVVATEIQAAEVGNLRMRFRESVGWMDIKYGVLDDKATYFGSSNTVNVWFERPFDYSVGFAFSPIFGSSRSRGNVPAGTNASVKLYTIGLEAKYFFLQKRTKWKGTFGRLGLAGNILDVRGSVGVNGGFSYYLGFGYEFKLWKTGVAPEIAFRHVFLDGSTRILSISVSLAVHLYLFSDDLLKMEI